MELFWVLQQGIIRKIFLQELQLTSNECVDLASKINNMPMPCAGDYWFHIFSWFSWITLGSNTIPKRSEGLSFQGPAFLESIAIWVVGHPRFDNGAATELEIWHTRLCLHCD